MAGNEKALKKTLLGWVHGALSKVEQALEAPAPAPEPEPAPEPAPPARPATGGLSLPAMGDTGRLARGSGQLPPPPVSAPPAPPVRRAPDTGSLRSEATPPTRSSGPLAGAPAPRTPEEEAAESKKRLGFITAYMKDHDGDPAFKDRALVYKILSEERTYQQGQLVRLQQELRGLPPPAEAMGLTPEAAAADPRYDGLEERRAALEEKLKTAQTRQGQLFTLMKKLTGVRGKTGGTGFLTPPAMPAPAPSHVTEAPPWERNGVEERNV